MASQDNRLAGIRHNPPGGVGDSFGPAAPNLTAEAAVFAEQGRSADNATERPVEAVAWALQDPAMGKFGFVGLGHVTFRTSAHRALDCRREPVQAGSKAATPGGGLAAAWRPPEPRFLMNLRHVTTPKPATTRDKRGYRA